jgi:hypothetical protein
MKHIPTQSTDPLSCLDCQVVVNGRPVTVHGAKSCKAPFPFKVFKAGEHPDVRLARPGAAAGPAQIAEAGNAPYAFASFPVTGPVEVEITSALPLDQVQVRPAAAATVKGVKGNMLTLSLARPTKVSIEPDGRHGGLLLFADEPETDIPDPDDPKVHYYGPGLHRAGVIDLHDGETLYLAPGAVVEGGICAKNAKDIRILGRGILCGDPWGWRAGPQAHMNMFNEVENLHMEGIVLRCSWQWTLRTLGCKNVTLRNLKLCQGKNLNDDGIDPCSTSDVLIEDCFIRTHDDNISVKAHCDDRRPSERIEIRHCLHWSDLSRILMVGPESYADRIGDIHMHDCEVIYLGPPINKTGFGDWDGCAPFVCIEAAEDSLMEEILIENVVVHLDEDRHGKDLIKIEPVLNPCCRRDTMGTIRNITFRNLECIGPWQPRICIWGKDAEHDVRGVHFENFRIAGAPLDASYPQLSISEQYAADITFRSTL